MNSFLKAILHVFKAPLDAEIASLKANRDANIATIEGIAGGGALTAQAAVDAFLGNVTKGNAVLALAWSFGHAPFDQAIGSAVAAGATTIPALYDHVVAFAEKEESYL